MKVEVWKLLVIVELRLIPIPDVPIVDVVEPAEAIESMEIVEPTDPEITYICEISSKVIDVSSDGNCFFHSIIGVMGLKGYTPGLLKKRLLGCPALDDIIEPVRSSIISVLRESNAWGSVEIIPLVTAYFNVSFCVHFYDSGDQRAMRIGKTSKLYHLLFADAHWRYIDECVGGYKIGCVAFRF